MKFTKLSLAAMIAMGVASSAFAVENVKVDGQIKLWYQTTDQSTVAGDTDGSTPNQDGIFKNTGATGDLVAKLRVAGDLTKKVGFGITNYAMTTLGLENNLVGGVASGDGTNAGTDKNPYWLGEAYFTYKAGKTIAKIGRQELDTPLAFTETWNAAPNTFEAAVLVNQDLPDTTLVAAYVGKGNGSYSSTVNGDGSFSSYGRNMTNVGTAYNVGGANVVGAGGVGTLGGASDSGAYALGFVNKSIPNLTIHPVYYNVQDMVNAFWADVTYNIPSIAKLEAQYAHIDTVGATEKALKDLGVEDRTTDGYGFKVSGKLAGFDLSAAYARIDKGIVAVSNTATYGPNIASGRKTKIYTATIASDGAYAGAADSTSWKLGVGYDIAGFKLGADYGQYELGKDSIFANVVTNNGNGDSFTTKELDLSVSTN